MSVLFTIVQKVDGATLVSLATGRNVLLELLQSCGFATIADQLRLKRLVEANLEPLPAANIKREDLKEGKGRKLKMKEIKALKDEEHHMYKLM